MYQEEEDGDDNSDYYFAVPCWGGGCWSRKLKEWRKDIKISSMYLPTKHDTLEWVKDAAVAAPPATPP